MITSMYFEGSRTEHAMYGRPRFLPRIYNRNYLIGSSLYTDAITDLNIRRGRPAYCSSSTSSYGYSYPDR